MTTTREKLEGYIACMAPHQKIRRAGKLLIEALEEIKRLERVANSRNDETD